MENEAVETNGPHFGTGERGALEKGLGPAIVSNELY